MSMTKSATTTTPVEGDRQLAARLLRGLLAVVLVAALAIIAFHAHSRETSSNPILADPSAVELLQIYVEAIFEAVIAIGLVVAAYIGTRGMD